MGVQKICNGLLRCVELITHSCRQQGFKALGTRAFSSGNLSGPPAFVFDIDGVLIRGKNVIPSAVTAMKKLWTPSSGWHTPTCFLTNGGGVLESVKAAQLSEWLDVEVFPEQVILSHTPMRELVPRLGETRVLVSGRGHVMEVAEAYGFKHAVSCKQLADSHPAAVPFLARPAPGPAPGPLPAPLAGDSDAPFSAVLVMSDPDDWYRDLQIILDVVLAHGRPAAQYDPLLTSLPSPVEVYFSNPDLLWVNEYPRPRLGMGAFAAAVNDLHHHITGSALHNMTYFGKPNPAPYKLAEQRLLQQAISRGLVDRHIHCARHAFSGIYAVGDNPAADIKGANTAGKPWTSMLVCTGVFHPSQRPNCRINPAHAVVDDVLAAVLAGFNRAREDKWHSMR